MVQTDHQHLPGWRKIDQRRPQQRPVRQIKRASRLLADDADDFRISRCLGQRAQIDPAIARERATYAIDNDGDLTALRERANAVYDLLVALSARTAP